MGKTKTDIIIAGHSISEYEIVYDARSSQLGAELALKVNDILSPISGVELPVRSSRETAGKPYMIYITGGVEVSGTQITDDEYGLYVENGNLTICYGYAGNAGLALDEFAKLFDGWQSKEAVEISDNYLGIEEVPTYTLVFLGDSNTASSLIMSVYDAYLQSQYGNVSIKTLNAGVSGQRAASTFYTNFGGVTYDNRLQREVIDANADCVIVSFGINDLANSGVLSNPNALTIGGVRYNSRAEYDAQMANIDALVDAKLKTDASISEQNTYLNNMYRIYTTLRAKGIDVIFTSPVDYDEDPALHATKNCFNGMNKVFPYVTSELENYVAKKPMLRFADYYKVERIVQEAMKKNAKDGEYLSIMGPDRTHFEGYIGPFACVYGAIDSLKGTSVGGGEKYRDHMAIVDIDATNGVLISASGAAVENLTIKNSKVNFTYKPKGVALYKTKDFEEALSYIGEDAKGFFDEIIKVTGLGDGEYTLKMNGADVGVYTSAELAEGVNIANLESNPQTAIAETVLELARKKASENVILREIAYAYEGKLISLGITESSTREEVLAAVQHLISQESSGSYLAYCANVLKKNYDELENINGRKDLYNYQMKELVRSLSYNVEIVKN